MWGQYARLSRKFFKLVNKLFMRPVGISARILFIQNHDVPHEKLDSTGNFMGTNGHLCTFRIALCLSKCLNSASYAEACAGQ
jgi:hypothetical protein